VISLDEQPGFAVGLGLDAAGNLYTAGLFRDTLLLAPDTLVATGSDVFLAGYTPGGALRWSRRLGGPGDDGVSWPRGAFTVDGAGNTYLGGRFERGAVFGEGQPGAVTLADTAYALVSYDATGRLRWVRTAAELAITDAGPRRLAVDPASNVVVAWSMDRTQGGAYTVAVGDTSFTDPAHGGAFLTKLSPEGGILWARQLTSDGYELVFDLTTDAQGHVYVGGTFDGLYLRLEGTTLRKQDLQADEVDGFVAHYDGAGRLRWAGQAAGMGTQRIYAVAVSAGGDLYVAGDFEETLHLGAATLAAQVPGSFELFVAKYEAAMITAREEAPGVPGLASAYPNPFRGRTTIRYRVLVPGPVRLAVYDVLGREVALLVAGTQRAGMHEAVFEAAGLSGGVYLYRLEAAGQVATGRLVLQR
jgi:hypothetical protein